MKKPSTRTTLTLTALTAAAFVLSLLKIPYLSALLQLMLVSAGVLFLLWLLWRAYRAFLWKVGRRLAFSYFLIGGLPIPMGLLLLTVLAYLLSGTLLGHMYRDAASHIQADLQRAAEMRVRELARTGRVADPGGDGEEGIAFGYYARGRRIGGDPRAPSVWPAWTDVAPKAPATDGAPPLRFFARDPSTPTFAAAAAREGYGVVALYVDPLARELSRRSGFWIEVNNLDDEGLAPVNLGLWGLEVPLLRIRKDHQAEAEKFFKEDSQGKRFWDEPLLWWGEVYAPPLDPATGKPVYESLAVTVNGTPRTLLGKLSSSASEFDARVWVALLVLAVLLFEVYFVATVMAVFLIFGLSRAVNRLSHATAAVQRGDFSVRIRVRRKDQVGALQRSFNEMAANLEVLVAAAAQKELLDKELSLARDLQKSLIPTELPTDGVELATLFEPSAAIGGDYFDVLRMPDGELSVIIADVSGHGLSTGLRMAMMKAALGVLVEQTRDSGEILERLDAVVRSDGANRRFFVTATLGLVDLRTGRLRLTNAGHPPTYHLRDGQVNEILLPSSPLGGLGKTYGHATVKLEPGDLVVWLSDGLIEATNAAEEPLGYDGVVRALTGGRGTAAEVRDRLLAAVELHAAGQPAGDDRTLVVLRYLGRPALDSGDEEPAILPS